MLNILKMTARATKFHSFSREVYNGIGFIK